MLTGRYICIYAPSSSHFEKGEIISFNSKGQCIHCERTYESLTEFHEQYCTSGARFIPYVPSQSELMREFNYEQI